MERQVKNKANLHKQHCDSWILLLFLSPGLPAPLSIPQKPGTELALPTMTLWSSADPPALALGSQLIIIHPHVGPMLLHLVFGPVREEAQVPFPVARCRDGFWVCRTRHGPSPGSSSGTQLCESLDWDWAVGDVSSLCLPRLLLPSPRVLGKLHWF